MKRILLTLLVVIFIVSGCTSDKTETQEMETKNSINRSDKNQSDASMDAWT